MAGDAEKLGQKYANQGAVNTAVPAALALGADPVANLGATVGLSQKIAADNAASEGAGTPWGAMRYGDPGELKMPKDASQMPGLASSPGYASLMSAMASRRAGPTDPYAASRENAERATVADLGHANYLSQQQMLKERQTQALQDYLADLENFEREQDHRNAVWDKAGRTAYGGGQAILQYFTKGGFAGNKPNKIKPTKSTDLGENEV